MIINCPECNKNFNIDQNLIPNEGRLLQCGSCNYKWFFKINNNEEQIKIKKKLDHNSDIESISKSTKEKISDDFDKSTSVKKKEKSNINYLNILLVIIISTIAFVLVLDTFKNQLILVFPNINFLLDNLYQSLEDVKLFILDLINKK
tara:strand:+ start:116 stop:556 length:441 start_codon:yes stop_codon:yes gene_type:complete